MSTKKKRIGESELRLNTLISIASSLISEIAV